MAEVAVMSLLSLISHPVPIQHPSPESLQCQKPLPLYLRDPHSLPSHDNHKKDTAPRILNGEFPLMDNIKFLKTWTDKFNLNRQGPKSENSYLPKPSSKPRERNAYKRSWKHQPFDFSSVISNIMIESAFEKGISNFTDTLKLTKILKEQNLSLDKRSPPSMHQRNFRRAHPFATLLSSLGFIVDYSTVNLFQKLLKNPNFPFDVTPLEMQLLGPVPMCETQAKGLMKISCDSSTPYRTINGTCNNIANPTWGATFSSLGRLVPANYDDGVISFRKSQDGKQLPSARLVSSTINSKRKSSATCFSFLHLTFGQFLDHDITSTPVIKGEDEATIPCCVRKVRENPDLLHPECAPIFIPFDDPFYSTYGATCMEFVRSLPAERCQLGPRDQVNQITTFIDGSNVYGSTDEDSLKLREMKGGRLLVQVGQNGENLLPRSTNLDDECNTKERIEQGDFCFVAGDDRVNEQVMLTLMHTVWLREHNRVARQLQVLNPTWTDEVLFQEARRIVVAQMQHIVYNEFLPGVLGKDVVEQLDLLPQQDGQRTTNYDPNLSPAISNEFSTAAFRFAHSMITDSLQEVNKKGERNAKEFSEVILQPFFLYATNSTERLVKGGESQNVLEVDPLFTQEVTGKLFRGEFQFGLDLVALNLQRGRDHGIGTYLALREACGLKRVTTFKELEKHLLPGAEKRLQKVYGSVEDIDLFAGGVSEIPIEGANVGPTFACIIGDQFLRLKTADRFWYEESGPGEFTRGQLRELHQVSFARVLCDNVLDTHVTSRWPMRVPSAFNPKISCDSDCIPSINLNLWKDEAR